MPFFLSIRRKKKTAEKKNNPLSDDPKGKKKSPQQLGKDLQPNGVLPLAQSNENSGDLKAPETKSDDDKSPLMNKPLPLVDGHSGADSDASNEEEMINTNVQTRLSLIKSMHKETENKPATYTDSSEEEEELDSNSRDEPEMEIVDSPTDGHAKTQESMEIDRLMKRKFSTRAPNVAGNSAVLEDADLVIIVGYSDSEDDNHDNSSTTQTVQ